MMVLKRLGKVLLCGARQATVKRSNRIGAVIMEDGMAIGKMVKLLARKKELIELVINTPDVGGAVVTTTANPIEGCQA